MPRAEKGQGLRARHLGSSESQHGLRLAAIGFWRSIPERQPRANGQRSANHTKNLDRGVGGRKGWGSARGRENGNRHHAPDVADRAFAQRLAGQFLIEITKVEFVRSRGKIG